MAPSRGSVLSNSLTCGISGRANYLADCAQAIADFLVELDATPNDQMYE
jgi:hypothetical protein